MEQERKQRTARVLKQATAQAIRRRASRRRWRPSSQAKIAANGVNARRSRGPRTAAGKRRASRNALRHGLAAIGRHNPECLPEIEQSAKAICNGDSDPLLFEQALIIAENDFILRCVRTERIAAIERMRDPNAVPFTRPREALARARARFREAKLAYRQLAAAKAKNAAADDGTAPETPRNPTGISSMSNAATNGSSTNGSSTNGSSTNSASSGSASTGGASSGSAPTGNTSRNDPIQELGSNALRDEFDAMRLAMADLSRLERYERRALSRRKRVIRAFMEIKWRGD
jgi:hypothetical protein